jgi:4a-hydroxytetrahydrobiopterin dehydratase
VATKLSDADVTTYLANLNKWALVNGEITRTVQLRDFTSALVYVGAVGLLAEAAGHHPDITITYNRVKLALVTHDAGGLTEKDFALAAQIDAMPVLA